MGTGTKTDYQVLKDEIITEFPDFKIKKKSDSTLMKVLDVLLRIITFNQMKSFMTGFITTIGNTVYVNEAWDDRSVTSKWITLSHERVHMEQSRDYGRVWFSILYLLVLPTVFAFYRTKFEKEAYEVLQAYGPDELLHPRTRERMVQHFTSSQYFWMWVKGSDIEEWYDETVAKIFEEEGLDEDGN
jgi:hypothetical protein